MKDFMKSLLHRRVLIPIAIVSLLGVFLGFYYFVYTPRQQELFNKRAFRVLAHISENFEDRIENYSTAIVTSDLQKKYNRGELVNVSNTVITAGDVANLRRPVMGDVNEDSLYAKRKLLRNDSIIFSIQNNRYAHPKDTGKTIREILDPIVAIRNNIFESVVLFTGEKKGVQTMLYKYGGLTMDKEIIADSLMKYTDAFLFPTIKELEVEGVRYNLFLYSFRIDNERYVIGGFLPHQRYKAFSQYFPISYVIILAVIILIALLSLPFLKIYLIGTKENITLKDVRSVIAMFFVIPFLFMLFLGACWIYKVETERSEKQLLELHKKVKHSFRNELSACLQQLMNYENLYRRTDAETVSALQAGTRGAPQSANSEEKVNLRDVFFYPQVYKNMDGVFWINHRGVEIEKWNYVKIVSPYLYLSGRQYFKNVRSGALDSIALELPEQESADSLKRHTAIKGPVGTQRDSVISVAMVHNDRIVPLGSSTVKFSMQPTLSKATGNYTVNIVKPADISFQTSASAEDRRAILIGISAKMYSIYKPVVPKGYNFCIVNSDGDILFHSESDRSLQENLFDESGNNTILKTTISNRDSGSVNMILYDREVKALVTPMQGLPYHLVSWYNKRMDYLFTFHVVAFGFLSEALLLLGLALFILSFYLITRKHSKLYFTPEGFDWIKPSVDKIPFYTTLINFQLVLLAIILLSFLFISAEQRLNFVMETCLLFPFSVAAGYYMFRSAETVARGRKSEIADIDKRKEQQDSKRGAMNQTEDPAALEQNGDGQAKADDLNKPEWWSDRYFQNFAQRVGKILGAYFLVLLLFMVAKDNVEGRSLVEGDVRIGRLLTFLLFAIPLGTAVVACDRYKRLAGGKKNEIDTSSKRPYLNYLASALLLSVLLISILPVTGFLLFASQQEVTLQAKSVQMEFARKLQAHRLFINDKTSRAKFDIAPEALRNEAHTYARNLKFNKGYGLYLVDNHLSPITQLPSIPDSLKFYNSVIYRRITDYLFLPADHFDFYNNTNDYYWTLEKEKARIEGVSSDELRMYYSNLDDPKDKESMLLTTDIPHSLPLIRRFSLSDGFLFVLIAGLFVLMLYSLFISVSKRVFLIGYFQGKGTDLQDEAKINRILKRKELTALEKDFWGDLPLTLELIRSKEQKCKGEESDYAECILKMQTLLAPSYEAIWKSLDLNERSVLYDFALDGFTNYRNINILFSLFQKSLIRKENNHLTIMSDSFRNFLVGKAGSGEIKSLEQEVSEGGKWGNLRAIFYIVLFAIVLFLFITREDISKRVLTIVTALGAIIPLLLKLFDPFSPPKSSDR